jgi:hypothetical protein
MIADWLLALEATRLARTLSDSVWLYPLVNTGHILGISLLVGSILPLDLRLLGAWRSVPLAPVWHVLTRTSIAGFVLAAVFGFLLFMTRATEYAASALFVSKMAVVVVALVNAVVLRRVVPAEISGIGPQVGPPSPRLRLAGGVSLVAWLIVLVLGRLVGYF